MLRVSMLSTSRHGNVNHSSYIRSGISQDTPSSGAMKNPLIDHSSVKWIKNHAEKQHHIVSEGVAQGCSLSVTKDIDGDSERKSTITLNTEAINAQSTPSLSYTDGTSQSRFNHRHTNAIADQPKWFRLNENQVQIINPQTPVTKEFKTFLGNPTTSAFGGQIVWVNTWAKTITRDPKFQNIEVEIFTPRALNDALVPASEECEELAPRVTERRGFLHPGAEVYIDRADDYPDSLEGLQRLGDIPAPKERTTPFVDGLGNLAHDLARSWEENGMPRYVLTSNWEGPAVLARAEQILAEKGLTVRPITSHVPHALASERVWIQLLEKIECGIITSQDQLRHEVTRVLDDGSKGYPQRMHNHALTLSPETTIVDALSPNNIRETPHQERTNVYQSLQGKAGVQQGMVQPQQKGQLLGQGTTYITDAPMINDRNIFNRDPTTPLIAENLPAAKQAYQDALSLIDADRQRMPNVAFFGRITDGKNPKILLRTAVASDSVAKASRQLLSKSEFSEITLENFANSHVSRLVQPIKIQITEDDTVQTSFRDVIEFKFNDSLEAVLQTAAANRRLSEILPQQGLLATHNILININCESITSSVFTDRLQGFLDEEGRHSRLGYQLTPEVTPELNAMVKIVEANSELLNGSVNWLSLPQGQHAALLNLLGRQKGFKLPKGIYVEGGSLGTLTSKAEYHGIVLFEIADSGVPVISGENAGARALFPETDRAINPSVGTEKGGAALDPVQWGISLRSAYDNYDRVRTYQTSVLDELHDNMGNAFMRPFFQMDAQLPEAELPAMDVAAAKKFIIDPLDPRVACARDVIFNAYAGDNSFLCQRVHQLYTGEEVQHLSKKNKEPWIATTQATKHFAKQINPEPRGNPIPATNALSVLEQSLWHGFVSANASEVALLRKAMQNLPESAKGKDGQLYNAAQRMLIHGGDAKGIAQWLQQGGIHASSLNVPTVSHALLCQYLDRSIPAEVPTISAGKEMPQVDSMIITDFDGTIFTRPGDLTKAGLPGDLDTPQVRTAMTNIAVQALKLAEENGTPVSIVTGNAIENVMPTLDVVGYRPSVIGAQVGTEMWIRGNDDVFRLDPIHKARMRHNYNNQVIGDIIRDEFTRSDIYTERHDEVFNGPGKESVHVVLGNDMGINNYQKTIQPIIKQIERRLADAGMDTKIQYSLITEPQEVASFKSRGFSGPVLNFDVLHIAAGKDSTAATLQSQYDVGQVVVAGDSANDLPLFNVAGSLGIQPGNAAIDLRAIIEGRDNIITSQLPAGLGLTHGLVEAGIVRTEQLALGAYSDGFLQGLQNALVVQSEGEEETKSSTETCYVERSPPDRVAINEELRHNWEGLRKLLCHMFLGRCKEDA